MIPSLSNQRIDSMFSAVRLFSDRTLMTSKCGKNKKKKEKKAPGAVCHLCSQHILMSSVIYCYQGGRHHGICLFCIVKKQHVVKGDVRYASVLQLIIGENQSKGFCSSVYHQI